MRKWRQSPHKLSPIFSSLRTRSLSQPIRRQSRFGPWSGNAIVCAISSIGRLRQRWAISDFYRCRERSTQPTSLSALFDLHSCRCENYCPLVQEPKHSSAATFTTPPPSASPPLPSPAPHLPPP